MTTSVCGIDISLTSTGIGFITQRVDGSCIASATTVTSKGKRADLLPQRYARLVNLAEQILYAVGTCDAAMIETPAYSAKGGSPMDRHYLWWRVVSSLFDHGIPVATCMSTTLKRYAAGKGNADKAAVAAAMTRLWPDLELGNADEGDGLAAATALAQRRGWAVPTLQRHRDVLAAMTWPVELPELATAA